MTSSTSSYQQYKKNFSGAYIESESEFTKRIQTEKDDHSIEKSLKIFQEFLNSLFPENLRESLPDFHLTYLLIKLSIMRHPIACKVLVVASGIFAAIFLIQIH